MSGLRVAIVGGVIHVMAGCSNAVCPPDTARSSSTKVVESSVSILAEYAQQLMDLVFNSVDKCPPLLRMALRQLWARVAEHFTGPENAVSTAVHHPME